MIDHGQVQKMAKLSRLELSEEEVAEQARQMGLIVERMADLQKIDTQGVEPTHHVNGIENVFRADEAKPGMPVEEVLANAPEAEDQMFLVPKIV